MTIRLLTKSPAAPVLYLIAGGVVLAVAFYLPMSVAVALLLLVLAAAAFVATLVTRKLRPSASGRTALTVGAVSGIVLVLLGFAAIFVSYWFRSLRG